MSHLKESVVLVTGANRGIGKAIVAGAIERGAKKVYAAVRNLNSAHELTEEYGERVVPLYLDLENPQSILEAAEVATDVEILINNAGVLRAEGPLDPDAIGSLEFQINVNASGLLRIAQAFASVLKNNGGGTLAQINSVVSVKSFAESMTYSASKAASYSITQALRQALAEQGTQVISVHPGPIATDMAVQAGMEKIAEPPTVVADALFQAIEDGSFHVFPDTFAKQIWQAYQGYAKNIIESFELAAAH